MIIKKSVWTHQKVKKVLLEDEKKYDIAHKSNINLSKDITWKKMSKNFIKYF